MKRLEDEIRKMFENVERQRSDLNGYQYEKAIPFLMENPFSALFIDMGMGKTVSTLTVIADLLYNLDHEGKVLVVGPKRVATETWPTEIGVWQHTAWMRHSLVHIADDDPRVTAVPAAGRTQMKNKLRMQAARSKHDIHIISVDWLEWLVEFYGKDWPYRTVIIDESSSFKDHASKRFLALSKMRCSAGKITRLHLLTATPAAESYIGLFPQIFLLDKGERLGKDIGKYRAKYFTHNPYAHKYKLNEGCEELILDKIKDICMVLKASDYLNLDEPTILRRPIHLGKEEMELYETLQKDFIVELPDGTEIEAETAAALSQKLLQLCSGVLYETIERIDPITNTVKKSRKVHAIHDKKIEEMHQIVDELQGQPVLVAYHHNASLDRLKKAFPKAVVMDAEGTCVKAWNAGKIPMLLMHPQSGGHGLNLQKGPGHHIVFFDLIWSLELNLQLVGRLARQGQKNPVIVWLLTAIGTMDETVADSVRAKEDGQDRFFAKLKRMIAKYRKQKAALENDKLMSAFDVDDL